mmetsp:Transcript_39324/g.35016  ORF Transcript_39324/g.35016 Transcript_39324/m.35016 type:complete len:105 (-) Transcript_39324:984-1298(-)|eukprot:CAMPEP_0114595594 /NCGR_PEP_ID=MMETSP0125-20121206/17435_1 /TAXON_ID=485358 ORGANISM="Aristerostoma sp., Strain ATCC 50986" /NCGR_SAMPLE_ID=MMETSP0125 /ASSEMBLY_ACC=CAM_ASM_000245 /LENGTH=104 /DNA_ID=CAMNT_0001797423 /DNA_START=138 /DNA_END=452 /DNA_ORIENTATION=+
MTTNILDLFKRCNPAFFYDLRHNPRRCLTFPDEGVHNDGFDNMHNEYILYYNDVIISPEGEEYKIVDMLGKGTFGQVVRCQIKGSKEKKAVALKVIKNNTAYTA